MFEFGEILSERGKDDASLQAVQPYLYSHGKFKKITWKDLRKEKVLKVTNGPYMLKWKERSIYYCGSEEVRLALASKDNLEWLKELFPKVFRSIELPYSDIEAMSIGKALAIKSAVEVLGAEVVTLNASWHKNSNGVRGSKCLRLGRESIPSSLTQSR